MVKPTSVGVLDKCLLILGALEQGPQTLADLVSVTALPRPTAHRLATALEAHGLVARTAGGRFAIGPRIPQLAAVADPDRLVVLAQPVLRSLLQGCGESAQLYRREGDRRRCIAVADREHGLRDTVPLGALLTLSAGSAAQVLVAWEAGALPPDAAFTEQELETVRGQGWAESVGEREPGVASVSAPVLVAPGRVVAAVSVSGPIARMGRRPGEAHAAEVVAAGRRLGQLLTETQR